MSDFLSSILGMMRPNQNGTNMNAQPQSLSPYSDALAGVGNQYPALQPHMGNFIVQQGKDPNDGRQLEYYPPWEANNPNQGKNTIELYKNMQGQELQSSIAGDALHYLGSVDPRTNQPIDTNYYAMKQNLINSLTPQQRAIDQQAYQQELPMYHGKPPTYDDWMNSNRSDAYIRGYITPDVNDEWRKKGVYNTQQQQMLEGMRQYLSQRKN